MDSSQSVVCIGRIRAFLAVYRASCPYFHQMIPKYPLRRTKTRHTIPKEDFWGVLYTNRAGPLSVLSRHFPTVEGVTQDRKSVFSSHQPREGVSLPTSTVVASCARCYIPVTKSTHTYIRLSHVDTLRLSFFQRCCGPHSLVLKLVGLARNVASEEIRIILGRPPMGPVHSIMCCCYSCGKDCYFSGC